MDAAYTLAYAELYRRHWWWRAREEYLLERLARLAPPEGFGEILDVGCGAGLFFDALARFGRPQGVETDQASVAMAGPWRESITLGLLKDLPPSSGQTSKFGLITLLDVIEHVEDDAGLLAEAAGRLRAGGVMVITVPALPSAWTHHDLINHHYRRYRRPELRARLLETGLELLDLRFFFAWSLPAKWLVRAKETVLGESDDPIPHIPAGPLNHALRLFSRLEQRLLPRPPFGTSLYAAARRAP